MESGLEKDGKAVIIASRERAYKSNIGFVLFGGIQHVLHRGLYVGIRQARITALGRHRALGALKSVGGMLHQCVDTLFAARAPVGLVAQLRGAGQPGGVAHLASFVENGLAIGNGGRRGDEQQATDEDNGFGCALHGVLLCV